MKMFTVLGLSCFVIGCAGPTYVRACTKLASDCGQAIDVCKDERHRFEMEHALCRASRETCEAELERLIQTCK